MAFDHRGGTNATTPYAAVMGQTYVDIDESTPITILDPLRAQTLSSWVARVIPGDDTWPSADELDTVTYIDAVIHKAPSLRPVVLSGIDAVDRAARAHYGRGFVALAEAEQVHILRETESSVAPEAFSVVLELSYEAYYRAPRVQEIVKARTGFDVHNTVVGKRMEPFPTERLHDVGTRPDHYRSVLA